MNYKLSLLNLVSVSGLLLALAIYFVGEINEYEGKLELFIITLPIILLIASSLVSFFADLILQTLILNRLTLLIIEIVLLVIVGLSLYTELN